MSQIIDLFTKTEEYINKKGVKVTKYKPNIPISTYAIDVKTGDIALKPIIEYSKHENLDMYKVSIYDDNNKLIEEFEVSSDHSLIVYHYDTDTLRRECPAVISSEPEKYAVIQLKDNPDLSLDTNGKELYDKLLQTCNIYNCLTNVKIEKSDRTFGYDFTVEDYYTFVTGKNFFVQDTMAVYHVANQHTAERIAEVEAFSPADGELYYLPKQDIIYSIYRISLSKEGREYLTKELGVEVNEVLDKKKLVKLLKTKVKEDSSILEKVRKIGLEYAKHHPVTMNIYDLTVAKDKIDIELTGDIVQDIEKLNEVDKHKIKEVFPKASIISSGARASFPQARQMSIARGYVADFWGNIVPYPIKSSYVEGLTEEEFFYSNYGTRKAVLDTAFNVADSGYLTRRLVYLANSCVLDPELEDCGTEHTMTIDNISNDLAKRLLYRYYYDENGVLQKVESPDQIVGRTIKLRSPIHCKSKHICKTCYGGLYEIHKSKFVGIIAAQTLGERSTQLTLRTFHTGGVAESKGSEKQEDITSALTLAEKLIDMSKKIKHVNEIYEIVFNLLDIFKEYTSMHLVHIESIVSEKIWRSRHIKWRLTNQNDLEEVETLSSKLVPEIQSPLLGAFFENTNRNLLRALYETGDDSVLEKLILNIPLE